MSTQELADFHKLKAESQIFIAQFTEIRVTDPNSNMLAVEALKQIKAHMDLIESRRTAFVKPLNDRVKAVNAYAKEIVAPLDTKLLDLKRQVVEYERVLELEREKERQRLEAERAAAEAKAEEELQRVLNEAKRKSDEAAAEAAYEARHASQAASLFGTEEPELPAAPPLIDAESAEQIAKLEHEAMLREAEQQRRAYDIDADRTKNLKKKWCVEVIDLDAVPKEFLIRELNKTMALAAVKNGVTIPGVRAWQETDLAIGRNTRVPDAALSWKRG